MEDELLDKEATDQPVTPEPVTDTAPIEEAAPVENGGANEALVAKIAEYMPEADLSTPEAILSAADELLGKLIVFQNKLRDAVKLNGALGGFLLDLSETGDLALAINNNFDKIEKEALLEELEDGAYDEARNNHSAKVADTKAREAQVKKNLEISFSEISEFMEEKKDWDETKSQAFEDFVIKHYDDGKDGLITKADLALLEKAFIYDDKMAEKDGQVAEAEENGKIMGRNENIVAKKLSKDKEAELLPQGSGGVSKPAAKPKEPKSFGSKFLNGVI